MVSISSKMQEMAIVAELTNCALHYVGMCVTINFITSVSIIIYGGGNTIQHLFPLCYLFPPLLYLYCDLVETPQSAEQGTNM